MLNSVLALLLVSACAAPADAQQPGTVSPQRAEVETDSDPTRPVFLSVRPEFYRISDDVERLSFIGRFDAALFRARGLLGAKSGLILRFELPVSWAESGDVGVSGLGDTYAQFLLVPHATRKFLWAVGSGLVIPTATDQLLGTGKWILTPIAAPVWRLERGLFFVKVQNFTSIGGDDDRPGHNYLLVTPTIIHGVGRDWWVLADTETKSNWKADGRTGVKSGFQVGRRIGRTYGVWVKPEVWWAANRDGDWNLKFGLLWYQRRR